MVWDQCVLFIIINTEPRFLDEGKKKKKKEQGAGQNLVCGVKAYCLCF